MSDYSSSLYGHFQMAFHGRRIWKGIKKQYAPDAKTTVLLIFPLHDSELNRCALTHLPAFLERKLYSRALALVCDRGTHDELKQLSAGMKAAKIDPVLLSDEDISVVCKYYRLIQFFDNIFVVSLEEPYGSKGLIGKKHFTLEFLVKNSIFGW